MNNVFCTIKVFMCEHVKQRRNVFKTKQDFFFTLKMCQHCIKMILLSDILIHAQQSEGSYYRIS